MDPKVQDFLLRKQQEAQAKREAHLIRLGLTDESKTTKTYINYINYYADGAKSDEHGNYIENPAALEVTDEEYAEICKYDVKPIVINNNAERTLNVIANIELWAGIICFGLSLITGFIYIGNNEGFWGFIIIAVAFTALLWSLVTWGALKSFCNISNNLHEINQKLK